MASAFVYGVLEVTVHEAENLPDKDTTLGVSCVEKNTSDPAVRISIDEVYLGEAVSIFLSIYLSIYLSIRVSISRPSVFNLHLIVLYSPSDRIII